MNTKTDFYLVRHAECELNLVDVVGGRSNHSPLTSNGFIQSKNLRNRLEKIGFLDADIIVSPAKRCLDTFFHAIGRDYTVGFWVDANIQELDQGSFVGRPRKEVYSGKVKEIMDRDKWNFKAPGGESQAETAQRVLKSLYFFMQRESNPKKIIFTHGGAIKYLCTELFGWNKQDAWNVPVANASITHLVYDGNWNLNYFNKVN